MTESTEQTEQVEQPGNTNAELFANYIEDALDKDETTTIDDYFNTNR